MSIPSKLDVTTLGAQRHVYRLRNPGTGVFEAWTVQELSDAVGVSAPLMRYRLRRWSEGKIIDMILVAHGRVVHPTGRKWSDTEIVQRKCVYGLRQQLIGKRDPAPDWARFLVPCAQGVMAFEGEDDAAVYRLLQADASTRY